MSEEKLGEEKQRERRLEEIFELKARLMKSAYDQGVDPDDICLRLRDDQCSWCGRTIKKTESCRSNFDCHGVVTATYCLRCARKIPFMVERFGSTDYDFWPRRKKFQHFQKGVA